MNSIESENFEESIKSRKSIESVGYIESIKFIESLDSIDWYMALPYGIAIWFWHMLNPWTLGAFQRNTQVQILARSARI